MNETIQLAIKGDTQNAVLAAAALVSACLDVETVGEVFYAHDAQYSVLVSAHLPVSIERLEAHATVA